MDIIEMIDNRIASAICNQKEEVASAFRELREAVNYESYKEAKELMKWAENNTRGMGDPS